MANLEESLVLLADSDDSFRTALHKSLTDAGVKNIISAINGLDALVQFKTSSPYLVIMSAKMHVKDGYAACDLLKSMPGGERASVFILIDEEDTMAVEKAYRAGASDFIPKSAPIESITRRALFSLRTSFQNRDLYRHEERLNQAYRIARLGHWEWHSESNEFVASRHIARMFMVPRQSVRTMPQLLRHICEEDREAVHKTVQAVLRDHVARKSEFRIVLKDGQERAFRQWIEVHQDERGEHKFVTSTVQNVTKQKEREERIYNLAHYDALTQLPNRDYLKQHLSFILDQAANDESQVAVILIDIDQFSRVNHGLGHGAGDEILCYMAKRLSDAVQHDELLPKSMVDPNVRLMLVRMDSDQFAVVASNIKTPDIAGQIAGEISAVLTPPMKLEKQTVNITVSMGISIYPLDTNEDYSLLDCAAAALKHAKDQGRNNYQYFMQSLNQKALKHLGMENDLRIAIKRKQLLVYYQPKVNLKNNKVEAMEALVRWQHPSLGVVSPAEFVSIAEDSGLIIDIGEFVLREACEQTKKWSDEGHHLKVAVNLSSKQFNDHTHLIDMVSTTLKETELPANQLELEITESVFFEGSEINRQTVSVLDKMGVTMAIDDFGTGYSSLSYLTNFDVKTLKIDKSFVSCVSGDKQHAEIVKTIIHLASQMKMTVVAEGVASDVEAQFLKETGCHYGQGFLFSPPLPAERFKAWMLSEDRYLLD